MIKVYYEGSIDIEHQLLRLVLRYPTQLLTSLRGDITDPALFVSAGMLSRKRQKISLFFLVFLLITYCRYIKGIDQ
jgi:hypothetical protein